MRCLGEPPPSFTRVPATALVPLRCIPRTMTTSELSRFSRLAIEFEAGASGPINPEGVSPWIFLPSRLLFAVHLLGSIELVIVSARVLRSELVHRDLTLLVPGVSRRQKSRWTPRK